MATANAPADRGDRIITDRIQQARRALWRSELFSAALVWAICFLASLLVWAIFDHWIFSAGPILRSIVWLALIIASIVWIYCRIVPLVNHSIHPEYAAQSLERGVPDLHHSLISYLTLRADRETPGLRGLVVRSVATHAARQLAKPEHESVGNLGVIKLAVALVVLVVSMLLYALLSPKDTLQSVKRLALPTAAIEPPTHVRIHSVSPGTTTVVEGGSLEVSADITGMKEDQEAWIQMTAGSLERRVALKRDDETNRFVGVVGQSGDGIRHESKYSIVAGDAKSGSFDISIQSVPNVSIRSVVYKPAAYTGLDVRTTTRGAIDALEGTEVVLTITTNRPVKTGKVEFNPKQIDSRWVATAGVKALAISDDRRSLKVSWILRRPGDDPSIKAVDSYRIIVADENSNENPEPVVYPVKVVSDLAPEISIIVPQRSPKELPLGMQQVFEVHALDPDFGLSKMEFEVSKGDRLIGKRLIFERDEPLLGQQVSISPFRCEDWNLNVGDKVTVRCRAYDNRDMPDSDGTDPNSTLSKPIELRIVPWPEEEPEGDDDGLQKETESGSAQQGGENSDSGQQSGAGGEGESSGDKGDGKGESGGGNSSSESSDQENTEDQEGQGGEGGQSSDSTDPKPSDNPSNSSESGNSDSEDDQQGEPLSESGGESEPGSSSSKAEPDGEAGQSMKESAQTSNTGSGSSEGQAGADGKSKRRDSGGKQSQESGGGESEAGEGESGEEGSEDDGDLHDGDIMERIREHMNKQQKSGQASDADKQANQEGQGQKSEGQQGSEQQGDDDSKSGEPGSDSSDTKPDGKKGGDSGSNDSSKQGESGNEAAVEEAASAGEGSSEEGKSGKQSDDSKGSDGMKAGDDEGSEASDDSSANDNGEQQASEAGTDPGDSSEAKASSDGKQSQSDRKPGEKSGQHKEGSNSSESPDGESGSESSQSDREADSQSKESEDSSDADGQPTSKPSDANSSSMTDKGERTGEGSAPDAGLEPEEVNLEYANEATDLVLDYLKKQKEEPDPELLDKLNWTDSDLNEFLDRWNRAKELGRTGDAKQKKEFLEQLQSLGIRPSKGPSFRKSNDQSDGLKGTRDSGSRALPPPLYKDAFDAFRRSLSNR